ncbi:MAG: tetratricopeptide repeat protein [Myxococcota bacterium]|nr:tetratricopeptide repeat protein [Myxococcota bacterium]
MFYYPADILGQRANRLNRPTILMLILALLAMAGCGGGQVAQQVKPTRLTSSNVMEETQVCTQSKDEAELLVVDLPASRRADLEVMMSEGLAAVKYDCRALKLLKSCHIEGGYAYKGTVLKEELIRLENQDEIEANLPLNGVGLAAKLGTEIERGATLDLAIAMVGQQRAARFEVARDELKGRCRGATHFVRAVHVGAFAMRQGERAEAAAAANVFGLGASGRSASASSAHKADGNLDACRQTQPDAKAPNSGCGAVLRLYLLPISTAGTTPSTEERQTLKRPGCPRGMQRIGSKCVRAKKGPACSSRAPKACAAPCKAGDALACAQYGYALRYGKGIRKNRTRAAAYFKLGCDKGNAASCYLLSSQYRSGRGVSKDIAVSVRLAERGCALGSGRACFRTGLAYSNGKGVPKDLRRAFSAYDQGCAAGHPGACTNLGKAYSRGEVVKRDVVLSFKLYQRACEANSAQACFNVGSRYGKGKGTVKSPQRRLKYYRRACELGHGKGCYTYGRDMKKQRYIRKACTLGYKKAC